MQNVIIERRGISEKAKQTNAKVHENKTKERNHLLEEKKVNFLIGFIFFRLVLV
jgi:hypothetical protein